MLKTKSVRKANGGVGNEVPVLVRMTRRVDATPGGKEERRRRERGENQVEVADARNSVPSRSTGCGSFRLFAF